MGAAMWFRSWLERRHRPGSKARGATPTNDFVTQADTNMAKREPISLAMNTRVLFVCMGNICRSPMAEGVFRQMVRQAGLEEVVHMAPTGTHAFHAGEAPDKRAQAPASKRGYEIGDLRARRIRERDFEDFDMILA